MDGVRSMKTLFLYGKAEAYQNYIRAFESIGTRVLATLDEYKAAECDALLLPGGGDVNPSLYGQSMNGSNPPNQERDNYEMRMIARFLALDRPILGICRGLQVLNVAFGGTLKQHIEGHSRLPSDIDRVHMSHTDDPFLTDLYGKEFPINSAHHQVVDQLGHGLIAIQWSDDGYIEAVRHCTRPIIGVQWHPERTCLDYARPDLVDGSQLLHKFIAEFL